jgi:hypothetical protein
VETVEPINPDEGQPTWRYYYYAGPARIAMRIKNGETNLVFFLFTDHLGSTNVTINPRLLGERPQQAYTAPAVCAGAVSLSLYTVWGESRGRAGTLLTDYGFNGQRSMEGTIGLQYFNARWYDHPCQDGYGK